ncbi:MAG: metallophosphoesterase [Clostridia bacterium]|nr:metallophosphoesterase [Clostridia bacterium]
MSYNKLQILKTTVNIGLDAPVRVLHVTDTHIAYDDPVRYSGRFKCFETEDDRGQTLDYLRQATEYAKREGITIVHTGDLIDYLSDENFRLVDKYLDGVDYIYAAGNHDFCHWVGEAKEDAAYKWEYMPHSAPHFKSNLIFDSRVIKGVNFVTLDNSYYLISDGQVDMLRAEAAKGYPIVLCMHNPLYTPGFAELTDGDTLVNCGIAVVGAPVEYLARYSLHRRKQQTPDEATLRAIRYIKSEKLIRALVVGHKHMNYEESLDNGVPQITTHGTFAGFVREITFM